MTYKYLHHLDPDYLSSLYALYPPHLVRFHCSGPREVPTLTALSHFHLFKYSLCFTKNDHLIRDNTSQHLTMPNTMKAFHKHL